RVAGNLGDARLILYLHEHWYRVFHGEVNWLSPPFYYPARGALAYSHTLFLQGLPYSALRLGGLDPYVAYEATLILFALAGYGFTVWLLRRLGAGRAFAVGGGILFAFSNLFHIWVLAPQSYTAMLVPVVLAGVVAALDGRDGGGGGGGRHAGPRRGRAALL